MEGGGRGLLVGLVLRVEGRVAIEEWKYFHLGSTLKCPIFNPNPNISSPPPLVLLPKCGSVRVFAQIVKSLLMKSLYTINVE